MRPRDWTYWVCQIAGWGAYSVVGCLIALNQAGWRIGIVIGYFLFAIYSIALTHLLRREIRRRQWLTSVARLALAVLAVGTTQAGLVVAVSFVLEGKLGEWADRSYILSLWMGVTVATGIWTLIYVSISSRRRELQMKLTLREADLRAIEAQINPHFLFNCLNSIRAMVVENPPQAQHMITRLANLLRHNLQRGQSSTVPLASEMEAVSDYLAIESIRFEDRLHVHTSIEGDARAFPVPAMLLQTLVENAVKHGIAQLPAGGTVTIEAKCTAGALLLEVVNSGQMRSDAAPGTQIGLSNARERLRLLYGTGASLSLANRGGGQVAATVLIPRPA